MNQDPQATTGRFSEVEMVRHLQNIGIDLEGFSLDGIDPIQLDPLRPDDPLGFSYLPSEVADLLSAHPA